VFARAFNQARRTLLAVLPQLARPDDALAARWLEPPELALYLGMDPRERRHACEVAAALLRLDPQVPAVLVRAALLHDLGKSGRPYRALERILVHLYLPRRAAQLPLEPPLTGLRGAWQTRVHHAAYGAARLRAAGVCPGVADIVARHHAPEGHPLAERLKRVEERF
jgi:putative nucleotidyltransferase with HDIG domain